MTDMKQNKKAMSVQELENVSGGKQVHPFYQPIVSIGKSNDEGMRSNGASIFNFAVAPKLRILGYGI